MLKRLKIWFLTMGRSVDENDIVLKPREVSNKPYNSGAFNPTRARKARGIGNFISDCLFWWIVLDCD